MSFSLFFNIKTFKNMQSNKNKHDDICELKGRKAMLSATIGFPKHAYTSYGMDDDIHERILYHINHGMLCFASLEPVEPFIAWTPSHPEEKRKHYFEKYNRLYTICWKSLLFHIILLFIITNIIN